MKSIYFPLNKIIFPSLSCNCLSLLFLCFIFLIPSCTTPRLKKNLSPENKEFFSKVRYIITKQEKKIFLHLPPSKREEFISKFWKKRDPDTQTEKNEFKEKYFHRIEKANQLFRQGATPGWLQDRGRIYILLGPPDSRNVYPRGYTFYGKPMEIWYYGFFPIIFIDRSWSGDYKLSPQSAYRISQINKTQMELKPKVKAKDVVFDFKIEVGKIPKKKPFILIKIPYRNIWFEEKGNKLQTTLDLTLIIRGSSGTKVLEHQKSYPISIQEVRQDEIIKKNYKIKIPIDLNPENYTFVVEIENQTDKSVARKEGKFSIKKMGEKL